MFRIIHADEVDWRREWVFLLVHPIRGPAGSGVCTDVVTRVRFSLLDSEVLAERRE
jgi:hypothetical protein